MDKEKLENADEVQAGWAKNYSASGCPLDAIGDELFFLTMLIGASGWHDD